MTLLCDTEITILACAWVLAMRCGKLF